MKTFYKNGRGLPPFEECYDTNYWHYAVQLNMYKYMLEQYYQYMLVDGVLYKNIVVDKMFLVCVNGGKERYEQFPIPNLQEKIKEVFANRRLQCLKAKDLCLSSSPI